LFRLDWDALLLLTLVVDPRVEALDVFYVWVLAPPPLLEFPLIGLEKKFYFYTWCYTSYYCLVVMELSLDGVRLMGLVVATLDASMDDVETPLPLVCLPIYD
jgi:hypothetical protein